ncbi:MAG: hypothetical protein FWH27_15570 [Planctomycetaceae bacterium]|nr:hypothetical protein [Planctomycetaceae bacterium]
MKRRDFLYSLPGAVAGLSVGIPVVFAEIPTGDTGIRIDQPFHGAVLHRRSAAPVFGVVEDSDGKPITLRIKVSGEAPVDSPVTVNGVECRRNGKNFEAEIELRQKTNRIVVKSQSSSGEVRESQATVLWLKNSFPRYRFTVDDTIFCLREIHRNGYKSLFDDDFLGNLRKLHRKYGTKFALNLFYETSGDKDYLTVEREHFDLSDFSDRYKSEWQDNADWLRLLFHAKREHPGEPYKDASADTLIGDFVELEREVKRFAGEETYLPATVIHFGTIRPETYKPLAAHGVTALSGYFIKRQDGSHYVNYQMDAPRSDYLSEHDFLLDVDSGIVFSRMAMVLNLVPLQDVVPTLEKTIADPNTAEFIDLMTHEQYFWPFYKNYIPDHWDRLDRAFAFLTDRGYKPVFLNDPPLGLDENL